MPKAFICIHPLLKWRGCSLATLHICALILATLVSASSPVAASLVTANYNLEVAIGQGNVVGVEEAINEGANVNGPTSPLHSVFSVAFYSGKPLNITIAKLLMDRGADATKAGSEGKTPLYLLSVLPREIAGPGASGLARLLVDRGARVDARTEKGWTPLMAAAMRGSVDMVEFLLKRGADPQAVNDSGETALFWVVRADPSAVPLADKLRTVQLLLEHGANPNHAGRAGATPISLARETGSARLLEALHKGKEPRVAAPETAREEDSAKAEEPRPVKRRSPRFENPQAELWRAVMAGEADTVRQAMEQGAELEVRDAKRRTALLIALDKIGENGAAMATLLIQLGADVTVSWGQNVQAIHRAVAGATALCATSGKCTVADNPYLPLIELLRERGANIVACSEDASTSWDSGGTPLQIAVQSLSVPVVEYLLPKVNRRNLAVLCQGRTLLISALGEKAYTAAKGKLQDRGKENPGSSEGGAAGAAPDRGAAGGRTEDPALMAKRARIVTLLVNKGAEVNQKDKKFGLSPLEIARAGNYGDIVAFLLESGATETAGTAP